MNSEDCPAHSTLPPVVACTARGCGREIGRRDPRLLAATGPVHRDCADIRDRLGLDTITTPGERIEKATAERRGVRQRDDGPMHTQPGKWPKLRGRRRR